MKKGENGEELKENPGGASHYDEARFTLRMAEEDDDGGASKCENGWNYQMGMSK